jgi:hypothetical protein
VDDRIRKIKKRRKKSKPIDVTLIIVSLIGSAAGCLLLGLFIPILRFLLIVSGSINLIGGAALAIYFLYAYDEDLFSDIDVSPRSCAAGFLIFLGFGMLTLYVMIAFRE